MVDEVVEAEPKAKKPILLIVGGVVVLLVIVVGAVFGTLFATGFFKPKAELTAEQMLAGEAHGAADAHGSPAKADAHGDASFVVISSISAAETDNASSYGPIKAALIHYAKGLARQYASQHIRTNVVSPGTVYFDGGIWHKIETSLPHVFKDAMERNPMGRMATPQDIANAAVFLSSPLSGFTSGTNMVVDGALSRRVNF